MIGRVAVDVGSGKIFAKRIEGTLDVRMETGEVVVSRCLGDLRVRVQRGVVWTGTIGGAVDVQNASGPVEIMLAYGRVAVAAEAGDVSVGVPRTFSGGKLSASGGHVRVQIDPAAQGEVEAVARWGRVTNTLAALQVREGASGGGRLRGVLNGGGPKLELRAHGGDVTIARGETAFELESAN